MDSEDDIAIIQAVASCLQLTTTVLLADGRRAKRAKTEQMTFPNDTWENVYSGDGNGWFHANLRMDRRSFEIIADRIESAASSIGHNVLPSSNSRVDYKMKLAMTMAYLAQESGFQGTASLFGVAKATAIVNINSTMDILHKVAPSVIKVKSFIIKFFIRTPNKN